MARLFGIGLVPLIALSICRVASAEPTTPYQTLDDFRGGTIEGTTKLAGRLPSWALEKFDIQKNTDTCGSTRTVEWIDVQGETLRGVFVYLEDVSRGKSWPTRDEYVLDQDGCTFKPPMQIVRPGQITVRHSDPGVHHNIHISELIGPTPDRPIRRTLFKFGQPEPGDVVERLRPEDSMRLSVNCEIHNFMFGWILAPDHPYATIVDEQGRYTIDNIPPGDYILVAWHPKIGALRQAVSVAVDETRFVSFSFSSGRDTSR